MSQTVKRFDPLEALRELVAPLYELRSGPRRRRMEKLGRDLAHLINRKRGPFTREYLENVLAKDPRQAIGEPLRRALMAEVLSRDGRCPSAGAYSPIELKSIGNIAPGSLVLRGSETCPNCRVSFVPVVGNQVYCSELCRLRHYKEKRNEQRDEERSRSPRPRDPT